MKNYKKVGDWGINFPSKKYEWGYEIKYTIRHKIRLKIGIVGSMMKNGKEYYFYGINPVDKEFYMNPNKYPIKRKYHFLIGKLSPIINFFI